MWLRVGRPSTMAAFGEFLSGVRHDQSVLTLFPVPSLTHELPHAA